MAFVAFKFKPRTLTCPQIPCYLNLEASVFWVWQALLCPLDIAVTVYDLCNTKIDS